MYVVTILYNVWMVRSDSVLGHFKNKNSLIIREIYVIISQ